MISLFPQPSYTNTSFLPTRPSPLSPRSANIYGRRGGAMSGSKDGQPEHVPFARRPVKKAPSPKQDELKERRRGVFLKKVREDRDDRRFEARGEDIMRLDYIQRQRQWQKELEREAPAVPSDPIEEEDEGEERETEHDLPASSNAMQLSQPTSQQPWFEEEVDHVQQCEERELEALLESMPGQEIDGSGNGGGERAEQDLWSDDDDYDALFSELVEQEGGQEQQQADPHLAPQEEIDTEEMDTS